MEKSTMESILLVRYDNLFRGDEVKAALESMERMRLISFREACVIVNEMKDKVHAKKQLKLQPLGDVSTNWWMNFMKLMVKLGGPAPQKSLKFLQAVMNETGLTPSFIESIRENMKPGTSSVFVVADSDQMRLIKDELERYGGSFVTSPIDINRLIRRFTKGKKAA
ncbi:hypothetical protein [Xanthovirga aplysinae]|uniref:hypothetical protein n=1 Tax=Xanthovirga aplysinae TaxID=2529853 RepID=UPI001CA42D26|nr:hypothetical protein [Xanthovirga aplysinae]MTI32727.1 hypothetical protein [Xanthovirga aplysinae]